MYSAAALALGCSVYYDSLVGHDRTGGTAEGRYGCSYIFNS